ncbi:MAG TPA: UvrD-helicase domain-containing protein [Sphaerochaeta sp.]|nr:UvrD-helicase domain-containing protein [Sphaerochaeta sp.]
MISFDEFMSYGNVQLDEEQRAAVYCDENCVVSAGAGSGKTMVLSYRFLRLVLEGKARVDEILTLTFTRKAAREMQQRIHRYLLLCKEDPAIAQQIATFSEASIATLDSFCSQIVQADSLYYGIVSDFAIDDQGCFRAAERAAATLLEAWPLSEGAKILSTIYSPDQLIDEVLVPLATRHYPLPITLDDESETKILSQAEAEYAAVRSVFFDLLERIVAITPHTAGGQRAVGRVLELQSALLEAEDLAQELALLSSSLGHDRKPSGKTEELMLLNELWGEYIEDRVRLSALLGLLVYQEERRAVMQFMQTYIELVRQHKRESGILSFADVAHLAVDILKRNTALRQRYKERFRYIMIDEFQDNNELQKELLYLLAERLEYQGEGVPSADELDPNKLFFVGDEKQSIYRFRGADVSVFKRLDNELTAAGGKAFVLETNYRSEPYLIDWFNEIFPTIMSNSGQVWEADFATLNTRNPTEKIASRIDLLIKAYDEEAGEDEARSSDSEGYAVAALIEEMITSDSYLIPSKEGPRRPEASDIALLVRTTTNQLSFERALRQRNIPYTVQAARSLMLESLANDFYAMLQLALYPEDRFSYAVILRSPFCHLSDASIADLDAEDDLFADDPALVESERQRLATCGAFYQGLKAAIGSYSLPRLVQMLFYESGYYLHFASRPEYQVYLEHYTFLHRLAEIFAEEGRTLSNFVDFLRAHLGSSEKIEDLEVIKEEESGVQIMTVHKSKGLEFPIVILADAGSQSPNRSDPFTHYGSVTLPYSFSYPVHKTEKTTVQVRDTEWILRGETEGDQERAELKRLLYVALTRSETHLVISGCFNRNNRSLTDQGEANNLLLMLISALGIPVDAPEYATGALQSQRIESVSESLLYRARREHGEQRKRKIEQMRFWYEAAETPIVATAARIAATKLYPAQLLGGTELPALESDLIIGRSEAITTGFGTLVHACIEATLTDDLAVIEQAKRMLAALVSEAELARLTDDARLLTERFFASEFYRTEIAPYEVTSEVGFFCRVEEGGEDIVVEGVIDLVVDQKERILIVDFKSDSLCNPESHRGQITIYQKAARQLYEKIAAGCILYLRDPTEVEIWE